MGFSDNFDLSENNNLSPYALIISLSSDNLYLSNQHFDYNPFVKKN